MSTRSRLRPVAFRSRYAQRFDASGVIPPSRGTRLGSILDQSSAQCVNSIVPYGVTAKPSRPVVMNVTRSTGIWLITPQRLSALSRLSHTSCRGRSRRATVCSVASPRCADQANAYTPRAARTSTFAATRLDKVRSSLCPVSPRTSARSGLRYTCTPKPVSISLRRFIANSLRMNISIRESSKKRIFTYTNDVDPIIAAGAGDPCETHRPTGKEPS